MSFLQEVAASVIDPALAFGVVLGIFLIVLHLTVFMLWIERKGSALIQNRIGANRANIFGVLPWNTGLVNTLMADPVKMFTKEDFVPAGADRFLHGIAPFLALFPLFMTFAVVPFGDALRLGDRVVSLQVADLEVGVLFILAFVSLSVYGIVLAGWASNNRWALLGGLRGAAQMISYELGMGLALVAAVMVYGTLELQPMVRAQGQWLGTFLGFEGIIGQALDWVPAWGIFYQPIGFLIFLVAGIAESKRIPFDLPESESELISGYFTEYSGGKQATFMFADFAEVVLVSALVTTIYFGGWQIPGLSAAQVATPGEANLIALLGVGAFLAKVGFFCWFQILIRWTLPRFRYDQLMALGWKILLPLALVNVLVTSFVVLVAQ